MSLRELAQAATAGPWTADLLLEFPAVGYVTVPGPSGLPVNLAGAASVEDAAYIAAVDPQTVLGLLDALDVAVEELGRSNDLCRDTACCRSTAAALARIRELTEGENDGNEG